MAQQDRLRNTSDSQNAQVYTTDYEDNTLTSTEPQYTATPEEQRQSKSFVTIFMVISLLILGAILAYFVWGMM